MSITPYDCCNGDNGDLKCTRCKCAFYCSQACQKKDWKEHKKVCNALANESVVFQAKESRVAGYVDSSMQATHSECAICLEGINERPLALPCQHVFCQPCLMEHQKYLGVGVSCPLCRAQLPEGLYQYVYANASLFVIMANRKPNQKEHFCALARKELKAFEDKELTSPEIRTVDAELLFLEEKYEEAIATSRSIISSPIQPVEPVECANLRNIIKAYMRLRRFNDAMKYIKDLFKIADDPVKYMYDVRFLFHHASECMYELGSYNESINFGNAAMESNRHYQDVHRWIALSQKALGQWDEAVLTMRRAVRYEAPWDAQHTQRCQDLLDQLISEQKMQQLAKEEEEFEKEKGAT